MPRYECSRQVECLVVIEADNDLDLQRQLGRAYKDADSLVENADVISFADNWTATVDSKQSRGLLTFTDAEISVAVENAPEPWVED